MKTTGVVQVGTEHLLLGLIAHDQERPGMLGNTVMLHRARETVQKVSGLRKGSLGKSEVPPFTRNARAVFESALTVRFCLHTPTCTDCTSGQAYSDILSLCDFPWHWEPGDTSRLCTCDVVSALFACAGKQSHGHATSQPGAPVLGHVQCQTHWMLSGTGGVRCCSPW